MEVDKLKKGFVNMNDIESWAGVQSGRVAKGMSNEYKGKMRIDNIKKILYE